MREFKPLFFIQSYVCHYASIDGEQRDVWLRGETRKKNSDKKTIYVLSHMFAYSLYVDVRCFVNHEWKHFSLDIYSCEKSAIEI